VDITTFIGILVSAVLVAVAILMGGKGMWFVDLPSLMIVLGGTMGATLINYPLSEVLGVLRVTRNAFLHRGQVARGLIEQLVRFARLARQEGILSFENHLKSIEDPFLSRGIQMAVDGMETSAIETVLSNEIMQVAERHRAGADIFTAMGTYAPAMGMLGTIIGLVQMLMQMEDPSTIGAPMAVALLTTFYGSVLANLIFLPIAGKLRIRSRQEILLKEIVLEGVKSIQAGENHRLVEQKLQAFLARSQRVGDTGAGKAFAGRPAWRRR
jgi:chemotaxis protein MotA